VVLQLVFHKFNSVESLFIFDKAKNLDISNLDQLNKFRMLMVKDGKTKNLAPKPID